MVLLILSLYGCTMISAVPAVTATVTVSGAAPATTHAATGVLTVHFLDVGQADSEFIELPDGRTLLIDAGNSENGGAVVRFIKAAGYDTIDFLVATHPHADHIGGMAEVINDLNIRSIYMPKVTDNTKTFTDLLKTIRAKGLQVSTAKAGVILIDDSGLKVSMLSPVSSDYDELNNYSAVMRIVYRQTSFIFMGDAQALSENALVKSGVDLRADVLKVGHHGSDTSTGKAFLQAVSPKIAVISVGAGNDYGHPAAATLTKLTKIGAAVYRTDKNGRITVTTDGTALNVTTDRKGAQP